MNPARAQAIAELTAPGQPYELREQVINGRRLRTFVNAPASLRALFESTASDLSCITYQDERLELRRGLGRGGAHRPCAGARLRRASPATASRSRCATTRVDAAFTAIGVRSARWRWR
jgi:hypothetical protein